MDVFKFHNFGSPTRLEQGEIINNIKSKMWIERYREAGEFSFVANASSNVKDMLPIGTIISHVETYEVMIVENHEISDTKDKETEVIISGRGFETFLENRIVGANKIFPSIGVSSEYLLGAGFSGNQVVNLIQDHINMTIDSNDILPFVEVSFEVPGPMDSVERTIQKGDLYSRVIELLEIDKLGIRVVRPNPSYPEVISLIIHAGIDRSKEVVFSYDTGEIESADYLWSNRKLKNSALVSGRWVETRVDVEFSGYNRRMMYVDASDIDNIYSEAPTGEELDNILIKMQQRGIDVLSAQKNIALTKAEVSKDTTKLKYRTDFNVGDLITISGSYNESTSMRINEFVEIEDETGKKAYPTLTAE